MLVLQAEPHQSCEEALVVVTNLLPPLVAWGHTTINFIRSELSRPWRFLKVGWTIAGAGSIRRQPLHDPANPGSGKTQIIGAQ
jgi:hypothetical protein